MGINIRHNSDGTITKTVRSGRNTYVSKYKNKAEYNQSKSRTNKQILKVIFVYCNPIAWMLLAFYYMTIWFIIKPSKLILKLAIGMLNKKGIV